MFKLFICFPGGHCTELAQQFKFLENAIIEANYHAGYMPQGMTIQVWHNGDMPYHAIGTR